MIDFDDEFPDHLDEDLRPIFEQLREEVKDNRYQLTEDELRQAAEDQKFYDQQLAESKEELRREQQLEQHLNAQEEVINQRLNSMIANMPPNLQGIAAEFLAHLDDVRTQSFGNALSSITNTSENRRKTHKNEREVNDL